jgi:formamidopyrimidine-DNA glycosylase
VPVKQFIMDGKVVVGVGNIYANEALFLSGIHPARAAGRIAQIRYDELAISIKQVLSHAIEQGGTTLRDFVGGDGSPGYFSQQLRVYGREGMPCRVCKSVLREIRQGGRSTVMCRICQR